MSAPILVIGAGKVGSALVSRLSNFFKPDVHDPALGKSVYNFYQYRYVFVCVDTLVNGPTDYANLDSVLLQLSNENAPGLIVIRSTVAPDYVQDVLTTNYPNLRIVLFPEFMTDKELRSDFPEDRMVILGGDYANVKQLRNILTSYKIIDADTNVREVSLAEAAMIKLAANSILATKVVTFNVIKLVADDYDANYEVILDALSMDKRLGAEYHSIVPSPDDGRYGFGGDCLPKDTKAMAYIEPCGLFASILKVNECLGR